MYANINNPANFQLQDFAQFGFRVITTDFIPVPAEQYRTLYVLQDAVVTATTQKGDDITSKAILAGTLMHGLFNSVSITSGRVLAYAAGRVTAEEIIALYEAYVIALGGTIENTQCAIDTLRDTGVDFFADASLVMIPEGYDTGVVYGQRPLTSDSQLTFTRTGDTATRVNAGGTIEKVRTNLATYSNDFSNVAWAKTNASATSGQSGYDDTNNGWLFTSLTAANSSFQQFYVGTTEVQTFSIYLKAGTTNWVRLNLSGAGNYFFDIQNGVVGSSGTAGLMPKITAAGNGYYRCSITNTLGSSVNSIYIFAADSDGVLSTSAGNTFYVQAVQRESGDIVTDYIPTTTAAVSVGPLANVPRIDYTGGGCGKLLLEPQRTNVLTYSEQFNNAAWTKNLTSATANQTTSPSGYDDADLIDALTGTGQHFVNGVNFSYTTGTAYTFSAFAKKGNTSLIQLFSPFSVFGFDAFLTFNFDTLELTTGASATASVVNYGNGWYRLILTATSTASNLAPSFYASFTNNKTLRAPSFTASNETFYLWGAQLEAGSYATSYIPTLGASVTRGADACSKTGISSLIGQTEGTLFAEVDLRSISSTKRILYLSDGTTNNEIRITSNAANVGDIQYAVRLAGTLEVNYFTPTNVYTNGVFKIAAAYKENDFVIYINGVQVGTDTSGGVPTCSRIDVGSQLGTSGFLDDRISQAILFTSRLTNAQLAELTTL